ncbi:1-(5-phosphoribosyl)-5-[(5-phosphoribosylamino)methylideneamino]imidazole-4-carboxamide isomerase [Horticoccus luteus]|uniref:1-(5-phosphoribosyl)-5-[(5-phosphoribosylamino)methylideneamino] imidazole-4-carboxamide isomerase n=1 Tax=Horticoccus luteus TaxID=2862869 RepID=A0A8F9XL92_9BACT|nr:1-(5-phosphoribosyl)-5-[(5-phosphoribosylamino)methylideneamino]imidazole-4-carboxamide isomerase [Horticoccus luteus]QYM80468.1 1-(5-phosphoribosyl)-5-[(5-phosphoribosylamino)methylideneamino]imidazole-4-carboxamide isomerase [Horticoccus luteus]
MTIYPAIDLKDGKCVRLLQGRADQQTVYSDNPAAMAARFRAAGATWIHMVDLDGAFGGTPRNLAAVKAVTDLGIHVQLGGGLRTREDVERVLGLGVQRAVIGTRAAESEAFIGELVQSFGDRIAVGIDAKDGQVAVKGWVTTTATTALALAQRMDALGVGTLIHTDISTDGMLTGPNLAAQRMLLETVKCRIIASGGVSRREDVVNLAKLTHGQARLDGVIVGKALYENAVTLEELIAVA